MEAAKALFGPKPKRKRGKKVQRVVTYPLLQPDTVAPASTVLQPPAAASAGTSASDAAASSSHSSSSSASTEPAGAEAVAAASVSASSSSSSSKGQKGGASGVDGASGAEAAPQKVKRMVYVRRTKVAGRAKPATAAGGPGSNASSRAWKDPQTVRTSVMLRAKGNAEGGAWRAQQAMSTARRRAKEATDAVRQARKDRLRAEREAREERKRKREEGEARATVYQTISNPDKAKKMNRKQLRAVKKMRVNERGVVEFVSPWMK